MKKMENDPDLLEEYDFSGGVRGKYARRSLSLLLALAFGLLVPVPATASAPANTRVEHQSRWWPKGQGGWLGTMPYRPSEQEQPFFDRLPPDEVATGTHRDDYDLTTRDQKYVGWFGIVRQIEEDAGANRTVLTVEHKYFDGLTDAHILAVSFNGSGDFEAVLTGTGHRVPPLSLIKVYGTVAKGAAGTLPRIDAVFVRNWHWGTFTFLAAYGTQRGSEKWRKANQIPLDQIYEPWPHPCHHYYEERLGKRPDTPEIRKRLLDAAGPLSPEARPAMERLADLLALGHTWSQAETMRQSKEFSEIEMLVRATDSQAAAVRLLFHALGENDERVSWSATDKFAAFDPAGDAIGPLVKLLDDESPRLRAGAARALWVEYGRRAAPAVDALSRCVGESDPELREYAILALGDIGPTAKAAVPALERALAEKDHDLRLTAAKALWQIEQKPDEIIPIFVDVLRGGDKSAVYKAAEQLQEMGPWAAPAVDALVEALKNDSWSTRSNVAEALGKIGPKAAAAIPALANMLRHDEDSTAQWYAAQALGAIGDAKAIPILMAALETKDDSVRWGAIDALEDFGHQAKAAVPKLTAMLRTDKANAWRVATTLGAIDADGISTPALVEVLRGDDHRMRRFAAYGLGALGRNAAAAEKALHDALRDDDPSCRIAAAGAYWSVSGKAEEAVQVLRTELRATSDWTVQMPALGTLARIGPAAKAAVPEATACLDINTGYVATTAAEALGSIGLDAASAAPALAARMEAADDDYTRVSMAAALWRVSRSEKSLPVLDDVLATSQNPMALCKAAEIVGEMGPPAAAFVARLRPLLEAANASVREAAAAAIRQIEQ